MSTDRGLITLEEVSFSESAHIIGVSVSTFSQVNEDGSHYSERPNIDTKAFRVFLNKYVGSPNFTKFKTIEARDQRLEEGKQYLLNAGYQVKVKSKRRKRD